MRFVFYFLHAPQKHKWFLAVPLFFLLGVINVMFFLEGCKSSLSAPHQPDANSQTSTQPQTQSNATELSEERGPGECQGDISRFGNIYYVSKSNPQSRDSNSGTKDSPWLTIQHAADVMQAGDTCLVGSGVYEERIEMKNSGSAGQCITFKAVDNPVVRGFTIDSKTHVRIIGFEITQTNASDYLGGIHLLSAHHCEILDNYIHNVRSLAIWMRREAPSDGVLIRGNRIAFPGMVPGFTEGDGAIIIHGNRNLVEYNDISHVGDFTNVWGINNILRNNYFHDCYLTDFDYLGGDGLGHHIDGLQSWAAGLPLYWTLMENNYFSDVVVPHGHILLIQDSANPGDHDLLFRGNVAIRNGTMGADAFRGLKVFHNTFVDLMPEFSLYWANKNWEFLGYGHGATQGKLLNNIFHTACREDGHVYYIDASSQLGFVADHNLAFRSGTPSTPEPHSIVQKDPLFRDYARDDVRLQSQSPAMDTGGPLTVTTTEGSDTVIPVADAGYFIDGWGIVSGDQIQVGSNSAVRIVSIDYAQNQITVNQKIEFHNGDHVNLSYEGSHPEIGAYESLSSGYDYDIFIKSPTPNPQVRDAIELGASVQNEQVVRYVVFLVDGIPVRTFHEGPYTYTWNCENCSPGKHVFEARAYSRYATPTLTKSVKVDFD